MPEPSPQLHARRAARPLGRAAPAVPTVLLVLAVLPLGWAALATLAQLLSYPYPHDGLEGTLLHEARLLWAGQPLYQPLERFRFVSAPYPPLHPLLLGLADTIAGPHVFWGGRLISLAAALGVLLLIVLMCRRTGAGWLGGIVGGAIMLSAPPLLLWATRIKPDLLALLWTTLGLYLATHALAGPRAPPPLRWLILAASCFALAFFTKQTAVAAPIATGVALLYDDLRHAGRRLLPWLPLSRCTLVFGATYAALALGAWLALDLFTGFQFSAHVWGLHRSEWWSAALLSKFVLLLLPYAPGAALALGMLLLAARDRRVLVVGCYALVVPITLLGAGETGANHNHLLESLLAISLAVGIAAGRLPSWLGRRTPLALLVLLLLLAQVGLAYRPQEWYLGELRPAGTPERYLAFIRNTPGEILADDVGLLVAAGRPLRYDDPSTMGPAARSGVWDQGGLIDDIRARRFSAIMLPVNVANHRSDSTGRWTPEVLDAVREHYRLAFRDSIFTYVPK
ncbi:MAG: glycosyltransferase family 39 protein [Kouleothrix sp.]|jgi:hypothetical protein|nr:glycosyltransferase family 39 protein [Kouleothrix sp.]